MIPGIYAAGNYSFTALIRKAFHELRLQVPFGGQNI